MWRSHRFRWGMFFGFTSVLAFMVCTVLVVRPRGITEERRWLGVFGSLGVALVLGAIAMALIVPMVRAAIAEEAQRPPPPRDEVLARSRHFGLGMCIVAILPAATGVLMATAMSAMVPTAGKVGPWIFVAMLVVPGALLARGKVLGGYLGIGTLIVGSCGMMLTMLMGKGGALRCSSPQWPLAQRRRLCASCAT
ncbi:MAG: hypothetical protein AAF938_30140 [Myxococcota bacterium]